MTTVKELLTNVANNTRKFLGTEEQLSLADMSQGISEASDESDFQTELIEEFSTILDRSVAPDNYVNGKEDGFADALEKRTDLVVTENGEYAPEGESTGFKRVLVNVTLKQMTLAQYFTKTITEIKAGDLVDVTELPDKAFYNYPLVSVVLPNSITKLNGTSHFSQCRELTSITLSENCPVIPSNFLSYCYKLKHLVVPSCVTSIGSNAFYQWNNPDTVIMKPTTPPALGSYVFNVDWGMPRIIVPIGSGDAYKSATNWSRWADYIEEEEM